MNTLLTMDLVFTQQRLWESKQTIIGNQYPVISIGKWLWVSGKQSHTIHHRPDGSGGWQAGIVIQKKEELLIDSYPSPYHSVPAESTLQFLGYYSTMEWLYYDNRRLSFEACYRRWFKKIRRRILWWLTQWTWSKFFFSSAYRFYQYFRPQMPFLSISGSRHSRFRQYLGPEITHVITTTVIKMEYTAVTKL